MKTLENKLVTIETSIQAPVAKVWRMWADPKHIVQWCKPSEDWHTVRAENDLQEGGRFLSRMEAKTGNMGFDFAGKYSKVRENSLIKYTLDDGREVRVSFVSGGSVTIVTETFEAEHENEIEMQRMGWQAILNNFRDYVEESQKRRVLKFEISIKGSAEKVYQTMLDEKKWTDWAGEFNPSSHFIGSWEKGSRIQFLGTDRDGKPSGISSRIRENIPGKFISIENITVIRDGKEITEEDDWTGTLENYTFTEKKGSTLLSIEHEVPNDFINYFSSKWPVALKKLKQICEKSDSA
jgi:uncharacterized protein YndB with AHSA1/START domain